MASENRDEDILRIVECIDGCWPELAFSYADIRKPTGEKFCQILNKFLKGFVGDSYHFKIKLNDFSINPEMYAHVENNMILYREVNRVLRNVSLANISNFKYGDLLKPTPNCVKEVWGVLVNFLAYVEDEEPKEEEIENEILNKKSKQIKNEKDVVEEERKLDKLKQAEEEKKMHMKELQEFTYNCKEMLLKKEPFVTNIIEEVKKQSKRIQTIKAQMNQAAENLKQIDLEKERAAEAVVLDPEALETELARSTSDKEIMESDFLCIKNRFPVLEKQIQDRSNLLEEHKQNRQRLESVKIRESDIKIEWQKSEADRRQVDEEKQKLINQLETSANLIQSKERMEWDYNKKLEQLREQFQKTQSDVQQATSESIVRKTNQEAKYGAIQGEIDHLISELGQVQKILNEGAIFLEEIHLKNGQDLNEFDLKHKKILEDVRNMVYEKFAFLSPAEITQKN